VKRILVIKLGAFGDFVLAFAAFAAIRKHHPDDKITLLTTPPFAGLAARAPWFDALLLDTRPSWWQVGGLYRLSRQLRRYDLVYDLQTSERSSYYFRLAGRPPWSGIAAGCSLPHRNPGRNRMHTRERQRDQLAAAGIACFPPPDIGWLTGDAPAPLPQHFAILVPGAAGHRPAKRWPAARFAELATILAARGLVSVILGATADGAAAAAITAACPASLDLTGRTAMLDIAAIAARAALAIGNDTGPMHLIAAVGCPSVVLFSAASDPALTAPRDPCGAWPTVLREANLADLSAHRVVAALP
jgi:ADP-heptose:LPS heptosyltransferase